MTGYCPECGEELGGLTLAGKGVCPDGHGWVYAEWNKEDVVPVKHEDDSYLAQWRAERVRQMREIAEGREPSPSMTPRERELWAEAMRAADAGAWEER